VLVADREESVRAALFRALLDRYVFSDCVATGGDAIDKLGGRSYALIILDFGLPRAGAAAVLESLRAMDPEKRPIVIALKPAGVTTPDTDSELVHMILRKPLRMSDAVGIVESCLAHARTV
jgi:DNA-binding response OmpR family regulator